MSVCLRYTGNENEAMEIVNDSYMKVLENIERFDSSKSFKSWYGKILVNSAIDRYRKYSKGTSTLSIDDNYASMQFEPEIEAELSASDIIKLFRHLPVNYRITFNLAEIEGYSHKEIGAKLGITASTSRSNLTRAKQMLRELYTKTNITVGKGHGKV
jgi:RNA polymerase sigma-70 factor (ECF subfamily)